MDLQTDTWPLIGVIGLFLAATLAIAVAGTYLTRLADRLADVTGLGEALFGAVLLGGTTSLPEIATSVTAAAQGYPQLATSNALGGIAVQTVFLAIADVTYRRANLEHAAASVENLMQAALLATLIAIPILAMSGPPLEIWGVHPASLMLILAYVFGLRLVARTRSAPLWRAHITPETRGDTPSSRPLARGELLTLSLRFAAVAVVVGISGYLVAESAIALANRTGLTETAVGALFTAVSTSLPELVTAVAAVRQGALTLAVSGIIGGNTFDVLLLSLSDVAYRPGSIYHAITEEQLFLMALALLLTGTLLLGMLRREKRGIANIGFESFLVLVIYLSAMVWISASR